MKIAIEVETRLKQTNKWVHTKYLVYIYIPYISTSYVIMQIQNADGQPCLFIVILILSIIQMDVHDFTAHVYVKYHIYDWLIHMLFNLSFPYFL